jgi:hypothetical protein
MTGELTASIVLLFTVGIMLMAGGLWHARSARRTISVDHVRVEMHDAHVVEDRVIEIVWRAAVSVSNHGRRPRPVPTFAERATVTAGHRVYAAEVYLEAECVEINPGGVAIAWLEVPLPRTAAPTSGTIVQLRGGQRPRRLRFGLRAAATDRIALAT